MTHPRPFPSQTWMRLFESATPPQRCEILLEAIRDKNLTTDCDDLPLLVYETWNAIANEHPVRAAELLCAYAAETPKRYAREPGEYDLFALDAALIRHEQQEESAAIERVLALHGPEAETQEAAVDRLRLWGYSGQAVRATRRALDILIAAPDTPLDDLCFLQNVLREARLQEVVEARQRGEDVDYRRLMGELEDLGYEKRSEGIERLRLSLEHGFASPQAFAAALRMAPDEALRVLGREFANYALAEWDVPFVCSDIWLVEAMDFLTESREAALPKPKESETPEGGKIVTVERETPIESPDQLWQFRAVDLEDYLTARHLRFASQTLHRAVALVWALPLFFEYLRKREYATHERCVAAIDAVAPTRARLADLLGPARWRFAFVHRWPRPQSTPEDEWQSEKAHFQQTFR